MIEGCPLPCRHIRAAARPKGPSSELVAYAPGLSQPLKALYERGQQRNADESLQKRVQYKKNPYVCTLLIDYYFCCS